MASAAIRAAMMSKNNGEGFADLETVQSKIDHYREHPEALTTWLFDCLALGDAGSATVAFALEREVSVTTLHLSNNRIGDLGATAIAKALETNRTVTNLMLDHNEISNSGAAALAKALEHNKTLTSLSLSSNPIEDAGATALGKVLGLSPEEQQQVEQRTGRPAKLNSTLTRFYLSDNCLSDKGAQAVADGITAHARNGTVLEAITIHRNKAMTPEGEAIVADALAAVQKTNSKTKTKKGSSGAAGRQSRASRGD